MMRILSCLDFPSVNQRSKICLAMLHGRNTSPRGVKQGSSIFSTCFFSMVATGDQSVSAAKQFRSLPIRAPTLKYIQSIGIGIAKRKKKLQRIRERRSEVMTTDQERAFFDRARGLKRVTSISKPGAIKIAKEVPPSPFGVSGDVRRKPVKIVARVGSLEGEFPSNTQGIPEVALAGRSNVGKSSLLNALLYNDPVHESTGGRANSHRVHQKSIPGLKATISSTPGETKQITFYQLSTKPEDRLWLVDLPGYGFAFDSKAPEWQECTAHYLLNRGKPLKRIMLLLDSRHGMKKADVDFLTSMESTLVLNNRKVQLPPLQLVLTKCDMVTQEDLARRVVQVEQQLSDCLRRQTSNLPVLLVSVKPQQRGVIEMQKELAALVPKKERLKLEKKEKKLT